MEMQIANEQENNNANYQSMDDGDNSRIWYIISIISWSLMIITIWTSYYDRFFIWSIFQTSFSEFLYNCYFPIQVYLPWLEVYVFLISILGFGIYIVFTTCKKNQILYGGMLGKWSKFHFVPLLLIASIYIIALNNIYYEDLEDEYYIKHLRKLLVFDLIFTILGLGSLIFIYIVTKFNTEWYIVLTIKKGIYSVFIILLWYNFLFIIVSLQFIKYLLDMIKNNNGDDRDQDWMKFLRVIGIIFSILFGLGSLAFSIVFQDLIAAFTNFLMYLGMVQAFFNKNEEQKELMKEFFNETADGVIDIIGMILSLGCIVFLLIRCKEKIF